MCGTEQSKIVIETDQEPQSFKMVAPEKKEKVLSPFEQYMRSKEEAQTEGDLVFEETAQDTLARNATSRFGALKTKTNANSRFYTTKQVDVFNNDVQQDVKVLDKKAVVDIINPSGDKQGKTRKMVSRFAALAADSLESIQTLRTSSSNQIFSYEEWVEMQKKLTEGEDEGQNQNDQGEDQYEDYYGEGQHEEQNNGEKKNEGPYCDSDFPADMTFVKGNVKLPGLPQKLQILNKMCNEKMLWKRASELDSNIQMIVDGIDPTDVIQGQLNNSYFLCAVSAVSEYQNRIQRLILQQETHENGCYGFTFNKLGNWEMIAVDDFLPLIQIKDGKYKFLGANSVNAEMWVPLMEKAYAKAYHGYDVIGNGGDMRHSLTDLTGAPSETFFLSNFEEEMKTAGQGQIPYGNSNTGSRKNSNASSMNDQSATIFPDNYQEGEYQEDQKNESQDNEEPTVTVKNISSEEGAKKLWSLIKNADINRHIICAGTKTSTQIVDDYINEFEEWSNKRSNKNKPMDLFSVEHFGLYSSFSYTVIGVAEYSGEKLIRLRNPKGVVEWKGDWGDNSQKWDTIQEEFRQEIKEDGIFYMPFYEFANFFNDVTINYYDDSYVHTAFKDDLHKDTIQVYDVIISTPGEYYFMVSQVDKRDHGATGGVNSK